MHQAMTLFGAIYALYFVKIWVPSNANPTANSWLPKFIFAHRVYIAEATMLAHAGINRPFHHRHSSFLLPPMYTYVHIHTRYLSVSV